MRKWLWALVAVFLLGVVSPGMAAEADLKIKLFKSGKADAFLFRYGDFTMLLDAGEADDAEDTLAYAREKGVTRLDVVILTHFDQGHIGGMPEILATMPVGRVILPDAHKDSHASRALYQSLMAAGITPEYVTEPLRIAQDGLELIILPATEAYSDPGDDDQDDSSLVVSAIHGENRLLFTGDIRSRRMDELLSGDMDLQHTFLKVPAHGRNEEALPRFLDAVHPRYAVITCSDKNPPAGAVLDALATRGIQVWLTKDGDIALTSDGRNITLKQ